MSYRFAKLEDQKDNLFIPDDLYYIMYIVAKEVIRIRPMNHLSFIADYLETLVSRREKTCFIDVLLDNLINEVTKDEFYYFHLFGVFKSDCAVAATKIQAAFRGYIIRKNFKILKGLKHSETKFKEIGADPSKERRVDSEDQEASVEEDTEVRSMPKPEKTKFISVSFDLSLSVSVSSENIAEGNHFKKTVKESFDVAQAVIEALLANVESYFIPLNCITVDLHRDINETFNVEPLEEGLTIKTGVVEEEKPDEIVEKPKHVGIQEVSEFLNESGDVCRLKDDAQEMYESIYESHEMGVTLDSVTQDSIMEDFEILKDSKDYYLNKFMPTDDEKFKQFMGYEEEGEEVEDTTDMEEFFATYKLPVIDEGEEEGAGEGKEEQEKKDVEENNNSPTA